MQLELISPAGQYVAEVFEDESTGERQFNGLGELTLPLAVLHWFLAEVQRRLAKRQS